MKRVKRTHSLLRSSDFLVTTKSASMTRLTYADPVLKEFHHDKIIRFYNCQLIGHGITNGQDELWIKNGKILSGQHIFYVLKCKSDIDVDCKGIVCIKMLSDFTWHPFLPVVFILMRLHNKYYQRMPSMLDIEQDWNISPVLADVSTSCWKLTEVEKIVIYLWMQRKSIFMTWV